MRQRRCSRLCGCRRHLSVRSDPFGHRQRTSGKRTSRWLESPGRYTTFSRQTPARSPVRVSLTLAQMVVLFLGPLVLATMVGVVLRLTYENETDRLKRAEGERAMRLKYKAERKATGEQSYRSLMSRCCGD